MNKDWKGKSGLGLYADLVMETDAIVGAIARPNGQVLVPRGDAIIEAGDRVVILAAERVVPKLESDLLTKTDPGKKAIWVGA